MTNRLMCALLVSVCLTHAPAAEQANQVRELPVDVSAEELRVRVAAALGSEEAWARLETAVSRGTVEIQGVGQGKFEMFERAPNLSLTRIAVSGIEMLEGCDGKTAWEKDSDGVKVLEGAELQDALSDCTFSAYLDWKRTYKALKIAAKASQGDQEFYLVDATRFTGVTDVVSVDAKTHLPFLVVMQRLVEGKRVPIPALLADYRPVGGVRVPHVTRSKLGDIVMTIRLDSIQFNVPVDTNMFARPR